MVPATSNHSAVNTPSHAISTTAHKAHVKNLILWRTGVSTCITMGSNRTKKYAPMLSVPLLNASLLTARSILQSIAVSEAGKLVARHKVKGTIALQD